MSKLLSCHNLIGTCNAESQKCQRALRRVEEDQESELSDSKTAASLTVAQSLPSSLILLLHDRASAMREAICCAARK